MSAQIIRCLRILSILSAGRKISTREIIDSISDSDAPRVSQRQIQRDLRSIEQAGIPLISERVGREQQWFVPPSYRMLQPLAVSNHEVLALHLLKGALGAFRSTRIHDDIVRLQKKLERIVPGTVFLGHDVVCEVSPGRYTSAIDDRIMQQIVYAITDPHWDRVTYRSIHGGEIKTFVVSFCRMVNHAGRLYVAAWHPKHKKYITLALDRIEHVVRADDVTLPLHEFDEVAYTSARFGVYDGDVQRIRLHVDRSAADFFSARQWHPTQTLRRKRDGSLVMEITAPLSPELVGWIVSWADVLTIRSPEKLKMICIEKVQRLMPRADV